MGVVVYVFYIAIYNNCNTINRKNLPFLLSVLFVFPVSAQMKTINLLEGLDSPTNHSIGVGLVKGFENHMALKFGKYKKRTYKQMLNTNNKFARIRVCVKYF